MKILANSGYHRALSQIETFIEKGVKNLSKSQTDDLEKLSKAVEEFESQRYPMPLHTSISEVLEYYMQENGVNKTELSRQLGVPNSTLSELISGKKKINLSIAKKLHEKLKIDGNFLLEIA
jgi:HTH-type transcriptional regulator/antitoxin HigA